LPPVTTAAVSAFANFARAAASHFAGSGTRFEVWNEPNITGFWPPAPNPSEDAALVAAAVTGIHSGDPTALVSTGGTSGFDFGFTQGFLSSGGGANADAIGVHPYDVSNPTGELTDYNLHLEDVTSQFLNSPPPIWDTEWGFTSVNYSPPGTLDGHDPGARNRQATLVAREMLSAAAIGYPLFVYYDLLDDGTDQTNSEDNFGLLATNYSDKPAMTAIRQLSLVAGGRVFSGFIHTAPSSLVAMRFDGENDSVVAIWTNAPNAQETVEVSGNPTATDVFGNPLPISNGQLAVSDAGGPVYVRYVGSTWLENLSVRAFDQGGQDQLIVGFVTNGSSYKSVLLRGIGPALAAFGINNFLPDPQLDLLNSTGAIIDSAVSWKPALSAAFAQVGAFSLAAGSNDTALLESLAPGSYSATIAPRSSDSGLVLAEVYDADVGLRNDHIMNMSARAFVGSGSDVLIGGFVVSGSGNETLLIRAAGPALTSFGLNGVLANPVLSLLNSSGATVATDTGWSNAPVPGPGAAQLALTTTDINAATAESFTDAGAFAFPSGSPDCAIVVTLPPGSYTVQVSGENGGTGLGLVEIYEIK